MKINEPFNTDIKSDVLPRNVKFELAKNEHVDAIVSLMHERNPNDSLDEIRSKTINEIKLNNEDPSYWLYLASIDEEIIGLCRFYHSSGLPSHKKIFPSPEGWYGMGIMVASKWRRKNIAKFLFNKRVKRLKELGATKFYSIVDPENLTSIKMHDEFGFKKIEKAQGFFHLDFKMTGAYLYSFDID